MNWAHNVKCFFGPAPGALGRGQKVKYHLILITKSISKIFIPNFVCVLANERYKTYQTWFILCSLGHAPGVRLWGAGGAKVVKKVIFKHGHVANQIDKDDEQNRMQVKFLSSGQTGDLGWGQRLNIIRLRLPCQFQRFLYQTLCVFSRMKDTKHIRRDFYSVTWVMPQGWDFGALGVPRGSIFFSNMVMWHIKSTGMTSRTEYK